jgi:phage gpG-like protein
VKKALTAQVKLMLEELDGLLHDDLPTLAGAQAVDFFKKSFVRQGWVYNSKLERWKPRKKRDESRAVLIKTGRLSRSIRVVKKTRTSVTIGSNVPYAQTHNEGLLVRGTATVRAHTRRRYEVDEVSAPRASKARYVRRQTGEVQVRAHSRQINTPYPRRQFMGESPDVIRGVERILFQRMLDIMEKASRIKQ